MRNACHSCTHTLLCDVLLLETYSCCWLLLPDVYLCGADFDGRSWRQPWSLMRLSSFTLLLPCHQSSLIIYQYGLLALVLPNYCSCGLLCRLCVEPCPSRRVGNLAASQKVEPDQERFRSGPLQRIDPGSPYLQSNTANSKRHRAV